MKRLCLALLLVLMGAALGHAAETAIQVVYNGQSTKTEVTEVTGGKVVPVFFPVQAGQTDYQVTLHYNDQKKTLEIESKPLKAKVRGENPCYYCGGTGKCQNCFPVGSGLTASGTACYLCNGSAKCSYCGGSGHQ